jgi:hypothetical protein
MRSKLLCLIACVLQLATVATAAVTPATPENRRPMAALIVMAGLVVPSCLLVGVSRSEA